MENEDFHIGFHQKEQEDDYPHEKRKRDGSNNRNQINIHSLILNKLLESIKLINSDNC